MGTIDDVGKVFQDLIAPDLKALALRLELLEKEMKLRFDQAEKMEVERFAAVERMAAARHQTEMNTMAANQASIMNILDMDKRLSRLESERGKGAPSHA